MASRSLYGDPDCPHRLARTNAPIVAVEVEECGGYVFRGKGSDRAVFARRSFRDEEGRNGPFPHGRIGGVTMEANAWNPWLRVFLHSLAGLPVC
jgi:hypothetical protein